MPELQRLLDAGLRPDAAIVDLRLGGDADGIDVVRALRSRLGPAFPALLVSGDTSAKDLARVSAIGVPLMIKPVAPAKLRAVLHSLLRQSAAPVKAA
jgi:DNA-binding response OmpR family regulator